MINNNNQGTTSCLIQLGDADKLTLGHAGLYIEGFSLPWPDSIDLN